MRDILHALPRRIETKRTQAQVKYFLQIPGQPQTGPWTLEELVRFFLDGNIGPNTRCLSETGAENLRFQELYERERGSRGSGEGKDSKVSPGSAFAERTSAELRAIGPHLMIPWQEFRSGRWLRNRRSLLIAGVGLLPLVVLAFLRQPQVATHAYWTVGLYFSVLWAAFFYHAFPAPGVNLRDSALCFFCSAFICALMLFVIYHYTPIRWLLPGTSGELSWQKWISFVVGVGFPEELSKAVILVLMFKKQDHLTPHTMLFYGLMSGLGFGIYEGVNYQFGINLTISRTASEYYLLNVLRLTSLPFLHAVWTGIAGHFIGFAYRYPERGRLLWGAALLVPMVLHGTYDAFANTALGVVVAMFSVLALNLYLARSMELDRVLNGFTFSIKPEARP